jgi:predicted membrane protein (TIGR00267 family)
MHFSIGSANFVSDPEDSESENSRWDIEERISDYFEGIDTYFKVTVAHKILRRYFVMNAFDGSMTSLGVVIGAYISHIDEPSAVISVILVGSIAMAISGFSGTYMAESAERRNTLNELEDAMLSDLKDTVHGHASKFVSAFAAIVDGSAPFVASIPSVVPFYLALVEILPIELAFIASIFTSLGTLFTLGVFLGRVSERNIVYSGVKMVIAGAVVALLALLLHGNH